MFLVGAVLRVITALAYQPALLFPDSKPYLRVAKTLVPDVLRPSGYSLFLHVVPHWSALWPVTALQLLMGLAMAALLYWALVRRGVPAWGATLAVVPVLLDPWQLAIEHYVLSDTLFEVLLVVCCVLLLVCRRVSATVALVAGLLVGAALVVRSAGMLLVVPLALVVLLGQARWRPALALVLGFVIPVGGYAAWFHSAHGSYAVSNFAAHQLYGRVAPFVDCTGLDMPAYERPLCPTQAVSARPGPEFYVWSPKSPGRTLVPPPGRTLEGVLRDFDLRVMTHQPLAYARAAGVDFLRGFGPVRTFRKDDANQAYWRFSRHNPPPTANHTVHATFRAYHVHPHATRLAGFLTLYATYFWVPGPLLFLCLLAGLLGFLGVGRARRSGLRSGAALFSLSAVVVLGTAAAVSMFSWRYQLPQFVLLPPAAALGLTAMLRREPDPVALDGHEVTAQLLGRLPLPAALHRIVTGEDRIRMGRYIAGSVICTVVSTVTFMVAFGVGWLGSRGASLAASATGAIVGYYLNRTWTWGKRGRADTRRELIPYWGTVVATAVAAAVVTGAVNHLVGSVTTHHGVRTLFDAVAYVGTYAASFLVKYAVFNRLFATPKPAAEPAAEPAD